MMNGVGTSEKLRFDLALSNLQTISNAQRFYLSALLVYLCLVWGWAFVGGGEAVTLQLLGIGMKTSGVWKITPLIATLLTLALVGSLNAAGPAWTELREAYRATGLEAPSCNPVFFNVDTHKNIFDYFAFLSLRPEASIAEELRGEASNQPRPRFRFRHFLYSGLFIASIYTTYQAIRAPYGPGEIIHYVRFHIYGWACLGFQVAYSVRPIYRAICRFFGWRTEFVYN